MRRSRYYESSALPWERAAFIRARAAAGDRALGERFLARDPAVRLAPRARFRRDRRDPRHQRPHPRPLCAGAGVRPRLRPEARPRRHPRGRVLHPDPPADPRRPRAGAARAGDARRAGALLARGRTAGAGRRRGASPTPIALLRTIEHRVADDRRPADPSPAGRPGRARRRRPAATASPTARRCSNRCAPHVERVGSTFDALAVGPRAGDCRTIPTSLASELAALGFSRSTTPLRRGSPTGGRARSRSLRSPAARDGVRGDAAGAAARDRRTGPTRPARSTASAISSSALPSGVNLYRLLEARPPLADMLALILAHAPALAEQLGAAAGRCSTA